MLLAQGYLVQHFVIVAKERKTYKQQNVHQLKDGQMQSD